MNSKLIFLGFVFASVGLMLPARAENPEHLKQLRESKRCQKCNLSGANLSGIDLSGADLVGANLSGANLTAANLSNADLTGANLTKANLSRANLTKAYLNNANLHQAKFIGASLNNTRGLPIITAAVPLKPIKPIPLPKIGSLPEIPQSSKLPALPKPNFNSSFNINSEATPSYSRRILKPIKPAPIPPLTSKKTANLNSPNVYPAKVKQAFIKGCADKMQPEMKSICGCMIGELEKEYTLGQFLEISFDLSEGKKPPVRFMQIAIDCGTIKQPVLSVKP